MSIAHLGLAGDDRQSGESRGGSRGDRVPPHDLLAEQSALGGMLLTKDAVADVIETVRGVDFYVPKHEIDLRRDPHALLARRADRRHRRHRRAHQDRRARSAPAVPSTCTRSPDSCRPRRTPATTRRSSPSRRCCAASSRPAPASCRWATPARARSLDLVNNAQAEIYSVTGGVETEDYVPLTDGRRTAPSTRSRRRAAATAR